MMNYQIKNMQLVLEEMDKSLHSNEFTSAKTLSNVYVQMSRYFWWLKTDEYEKNRLGTNLLNQLTKVKELYSKIVENAIPIVITEKDYSSLNILNSISENLKNVASKLDESLYNYIKSENKNPYQSDLIIEELLNKSIQNGLLITATNEMLRGKGKTTALIKKAHELDISLIVGNHHTKNLIDNQSREMGVHIDCRYMNSIEKVIGTRLKQDKFLVDDTVLNTIIKELIKNGNTFIGGFNSL